MHGIDVEVLLASGYAIFLAFVAAAFELAARHSHQRMRKIPTVGFSYHPELDIWKCPNGKYLYRAAAARESSVVRYRAQAHHCNSCPIKSRCTDSEEGRVIEIHTDSWLQAELRTFHRGLSLTLLLLADLILVLRPLDYVTKLVSGLLACELSLDGNPVAIHTTIPGPSLLAQASDVSDSAFA
jgi:hypothetical protein